MRLISDKERWTIEDCVAELCRSDDGFKPDRVRTCLPTRYATVEVVANPTPSIVPQSDIVAPRSGRAPASMHNLRLYEQRGRGVQSGIPCTNTESSPESRYQNGGGAGDVPKVQTRRAIELFTVNWSWSWWLAVTEWQSCRRKRYNKVRYGNTAGLLSFPRPQSQGISSSRPAGEQGPSKLMTSNLRPHVTALRSVEGITR